MSPVLITSAAAFVAVFALVVGLMFLIGAFGKSKTEDRLQILLGPKVSASDGSSLLKQEAFREGVQGLSGIVQGWMASLKGLNHLFEQSNSPISANIFLMLSMGCAALGVVAAAFAKAPVPLYPLVMIVFSGFPLMWLLMRRRSRLKRFAKQLPDGLELVARALRAGHGLVSGMQCVADEMLSPIADEFNNVVESQTLGMPLEQAFQKLLDRVPSHDLRFFVTAVNMQRQMGGNLAEILDKIAYIVRERFKILGQVQALTGEGRISGSVLMVLPMILFAVVYHLNPEYVMVLFTDANGKKMLLAAVVLQIIGALSIKKIVDIKI